MENPWKNWRFSIIGAGLYVDNEVGAVGATGRGEEMIRSCGSFLGVELMRNGKSPQGLRGSM